MVIQIDPHTLKRAEERGTNKTEIYEVINTGFDIPAQYNRLAKAKIFQFNNHRLGKYYNQKRVEVIYTVENDVIITITVSVYYGTWELENANHL